MSTLWYAFCKYSGINGNDMTKKAINTLYREWRKTNGNHKPNRAIVRMHWEDEPAVSIVDTIALRVYDDICYPADDCWLLWYSNGLRGLLQLLTPDNGSEFVVEEVLEFYKNY